MTVSPWFNVQHAPMGAYASLTFGHAHTRGGVSQLCGRPGQQNVFIGWQQGNAPLRLLPFFVPAADERAAYEVDANLSSAPAASIEAHEVERTLGPASDRWQCGPLTLEFVSPRVELPDPSAADVAALRLASCPAVVARLRLDNGSGLAPVRAVFGLQDEVPFRDLESDGTPTLRGVAVRGDFGIAARPAPGVRAFSEFGIEDALIHHRTFRLGKIGGLVFEAAPGEVAQWQFAVGFHRPGIVTTGREARFFYTRFFERLEAVLAFALEHSEDYATAARVQSEELERHVPSEDRRFLYAQAAHSYYGSTLWLEADGDPLWVVAEGEYEMFNTLDLTVDQAFYELRHHPWTLRNVLDQFADRYSYIDEVRHPESGEHVLGGVTFCHDQGVSMQWSPPGHSAYEQPNIPGRCFSYMAYEELTNYILCLALYVTHTGDDAYAQLRGGLLRRCFESLLRRDHPDPAKRRGVMGCETARTGSGAEITTYDSLDASLGPARENGYLAVKSWAAHLAVASLAQRQGDPRLLGEARRMAELAATTMLAAFDPVRRCFPATLDGQVTSAAIPWVEPLLYPMILQLPRGWLDEMPHRDLIERLREHLTTILSDGSCRFEDGGWRLSSSSDNAWLSKIIIAQHVAHACLQLPEAVLRSAEADRAHAGWLRNSGYWAASDQFVRGHAQGSRYYPRLVTAVLFFEP